MDIIWTVVSISIRYQQLSKTYIYEILILNLIGDEYAVNPVVLYISQLAMLNKYKTISVF